MMNRSGLILMGSADRRTMASINAVAIVWKRKSEAGKNRIDMDAYAGLPSPVVQAPLAYEIDIHPPAHSLDT
jgi:hypothetical protein